MYLRATKEALSVFFSYCFACLILKTLKKGNLLWLVKTDLK